MVQHEIEYKVAFNESTSTVWIRLLGGLGLFKVGLPATIAAGTKTEVLLSLLAIHHSDGVSRETLLTVLWPSQEPGLAVQSLNSLICSLRRLLGPEIRGAN